MSNIYGVSEADYNLAKKQAARRAEMRKEFLKQRTNPFKPTEGYIFDPAIQRFNSMKVTQLEYFQPNIRTSLFGIGVVVIPMLAYGWLVWNERNNREQKIRKGELRYKDRAFKLC